MTTRAFALSTIWLVKLTPKWKFNKIKWKFNSVCTLVPFRDSKFPWVSNKVHKWVVHQVVGKHYGFLAFSQKPNFDSMKYYTIIINNRTNSYVDIIINYWKKFMLVNLDNNWRYLRFSVMLDLYFGSSYCTAYALT